jgi:molecular chaperone GrpE
MSESQPNRRTQQQTAQQEPGEATARTEEAAGAPGARARAAGAQEAAQAGQPGAAPDQAEAPMAVTEETATAEKAVADMRDRWQRAEAELDNTRKRYERQLADQWRAERARVAAEWLPVLDNLERALSHAGADPQTILEGVEAVRQQALGVLEHLGFNRLDDVGARFDPSRHEAAQVVDVPDAEPGTVVAVLRPGYAAVDGMLRPAVVAVAGKRD